MSVTRRQVLQSAGAALAAPGVARAALPRVAVIGGGMAGVATAWLLDGLAEVTLFEAAPVLGGNVRTVPVTLDGQTWAVDMGAQYFHPGPYPTYVALLAQLGLVPGAGTHAFTASITVDAPGEVHPRFVSPVLPDRAWALTEPWNRAGLQAFQRAFSAAQRRELRGVPWTQTLGDWLPRLGLDPAQWEGMLLPWAASLNQSGIEAARGLSARSAMVFAALALPDNPLAPVQYHVLDAGMAEPLHRMRDATTSVDWRLDQRVLFVQRSGGAYTVASAGGAVQVDHIVFAASGEPTRALLAGLPDTGRRRAALDRIPFYDARLALHTDPAYAPADPALRSFLNARVDGGFCEASMDLSGVLPTGPGGPRPPLWKSWVTHRGAAPAQVLHEEQFRHVLPSPGAIRAQQALQSQQGQDGLWIVGGYTKPYDAQETALLSAMEAVAGLAPASARRRQLLAARTAH